MVKITTTGFSFVLQKPSPTAILAIRSEFLQFFFKTPMAFLANDGAFCQKKFHFPLPMPIYNPHFTSSLHKFLSSLSSSQTFYIQKYSIKSKSRLSNKSRLRLSTKSLSKLSILDITKAKTASSLNF